jgi:hypothetical protein
MTVLYKYYDRSERTIACGGDFDRSFSSSIALYPLKLQQQMAEIHHFESCFSLKNHKLMTRLESINLGLVDPKSRVDRLSIPFHCLTSGLREYVFQAGRSRSKKFL